MEIKLITLAEWEREALRHALAELLALRAMHAVRRPRLTPGGAA